MFKIYWIFKLINFFVFLIYSQVFAQSQNVNLRGKWNTGQCYSVFIKDNYAYVGNGVFFEILNIEYAGNPYSISQISLPSPILDIFVSGSYVYAAAYEGGLRIIDVSNPQTPVEVGYYNTDGYSEGIFISGNYAFIADGDSGLCIINVSNPYNPAKTGSLTSGDYAYDIYISGDYAYLADGNEGLKIIDINDKENPVLVGNFNNGDRAKGVFVKDCYAFIAYESCGLKIIDINNPENPADIGSFNPGTSFRNIFVADEYAYISDSDSGLRIIDISSPENPIQSGYYEILNSSRDIFVSGNHVFIGAAERGLYKFENLLLNNENIKIAIDLETEYSSEYDSSSSITSIGADRYVFASLYARKIYNLNSFFTKVSFDTSKLSFVSVKENVMFVEDNILGTSGYSTAADSFNCNNNEILIKLSRDDDIGITSGNWGFLGYIKFKTKSTFSLYDTTYINFSLAEFTNMYDETKIVSIDDENFTQNAVINGSRTIVLPVELVDFCAEVKKNRVLLKWRTESELNNFGFEVERSAENDNFKKIAFVQGNGTTEGAKHYGYIDENISTGIYRYRLKQIDYDGYFNYSNVITITLEEFQSPRLFQNFPNPFNPSTTICFELVKRGYTEIDIYSITGKHIRKIISTVLESGYHEYEFDAKGLASGIYFYTLKTGSYSESKKLIILR